MKTIRTTILCLGAVLLAASSLAAQSLSEYRGFAIGTSLPAVLKLSQEKMADVRTLHTRPMLIQELNWWPFGSSAASSRPDSVEQILFSFSNGQLYKISVNYDHISTEGLTAADMVKSISANYGPPTSVALEIDSAPNAVAYNVKQKPLASWEDSRFSVDLVLSPFTNRFGLVIYSKEVDTAADLASTEAVKLEEQERPEKEATQRKKEADDLEVAREKNQKTFHP